MVSKISQRTTSGTILLPAVALWLIAQPFGGFNVVFVVAIALASIGACMSVLLSRYAPKKIRNPQTADAAPWWREILNVLDREIIRASVLSFFSHVTFLAVASFLVLCAREIGVDNIGWFYAVSGTTSILARPILGKVPITSATRVGRLLHPAGACSGNTRVRCQPDRLDDFGSALHAGIGD